MATLNIISAGAAQSAVLQVARGFESLGHKIVASFGAVGAQRGRLLSSVPADVVVLTHVMIQIGRAHV